MVRQTAFLGPLSTLFFTSLCGTQKKSCIFSYSFQFGREGGSIFFYQSVETIKVLSVYSFQKYKYPRWNVIFKNVLSALCIKCWLVNQNNINTVALMYHQNCLIRQLSRRVMSMFLFWNKSTLGFWAEEYSLHFVWSPHSTNIILTRELILVSYNSNNNIQQESIIFFTIYHTLFFCRTFK